MTAIALEEAQGRLCALVQPLAQREIVGLDAAVGRVLARDYASTLDSPPFARSPLDGYALRAADSVGATRKTPVRLRVVEKVVAGHVPTCSILPGTVVRIMTGAPLPDGADCVLRQEDTDYGEDEVGIYGALRPHDNVIDRGEDFSAGMLVARAGERVDAGLSGVLAMAGIAEVEVYRRPRIAVVTTGDELVPLGEELRPGMVFDSNGQLLRGCLAELGLVPSLVTHASDDAPAVAALIDELCATQDLVVTTGGVSVGQRDIMHDVALGLGEEELFWRVALKPGSPAMAFSHGGAPVLCLSGNPFGAFVTWQLLARPLLATLTRDDTLRTGSCTATVVGGFPKASRQRRFVRARLEGGVATIPAANHSSGALFALRGCTCLIDIPAGTGPLVEGDAVRVVTL